jgi:uncharacterized LabA/DUF88 family protein
MPPEPAVKRTVAFIDGQNLFHSAREAFGYTWPNYVARSVCAKAGWDLVRTHFYTGVPDALDDPRWSRFWGAKLLFMSRCGVKVYSRPLRYRNKRVRLPDGTDHTFLAGEEKGIDVRIALDVIRGASRNEYDVALIFSQDQDLPEAAEEIRSISREQGRWIKVASAAPRAGIAGASRRRTGILWNGLCTTPASMPATTADGGGMGAGEFTGREAAWRTRTGTGCGGRRTRTGGWRRG